MDEPDEDVLMANQLVRARIDESHRYECLVCPKNASFDDVDKHTSDELHVRALERFSVTFNYHQNRIKCRLCDADVDRDALKEHGKSHRLAPWHEPEEKYRIFVENRIIACENEFYCCLCEIVFAGWSTAFLHIDDRPHRLRKSEESNTLADDFFTKIPADVSLECLIVEALVPRDGGILDCRICDLQNVEYAEIDRHVKGFVHHWYKITFADKLRARGPIRSIATIRDNCLFADSSYERFDSPKIDGQPCDESSPRPYLERINDATFRCYFCDLTVFASPRNINIHAVGKFHEDSLKKHGCDSVVLKEADTYHCDICDCDLVGLDAVYHHLKNSCHSVRLAIRRMLAELERNLSTPPADNIARTSPRAKSASEIVGPKEEKSSIESIKVEPPKPAVPIIAKSVYQPFSRHYIARPRPPKPLEPLFPNVVFKTIPSNYIKGAGPANSRCVVCSVELSGEAEIGTHIVGVLHEISMKKYGCDAVTHVGGNLYYCRCCNCRIFGDDNVYLHVKGRQHAIEWSSERKKLEETRKPEVPETTRVPLSTILTSEVTKMVEEAKSNQAASATKSQRNGTRLRDPRTILPEAVTYCEACNVRFANCADLHVHLAIHFSGDFARTRLTRATKIQESVRSNDGISVDKLKSTISNIVEISDNALECSRDDCRTPTKSIMQKFVRLANFDKEDIYDMQDKLRELELGMKFCLFTETTKVYCLVCRKFVANTLQNCFDHLRGLEHCDYLERMERDDKLFDDFPEQFSEIDLAYEYMEDVSDETVRCLVCRANVENLDVEISYHTEDENHGKSREEMHARARDNFDSVKSRMHCDWYNVQKYWCVLCEATCDTEASFAKHLESSKHVAAVEQSDNAERSLIYDFCPPCALLWYGYRCTYAYHCNVTSHKWLAQDGHYVLNELTESAKNHLATLERYIDEAIETLDDNSTREREKERIAMRDLENAVWTKHCNARAYGYGSRTAGLEGPDSDFHVFLDCENLYNGCPISKDRLSSLMTDVQRCLSENPQSWDLYELRTDCRDPIIRAHHRATQLLCEISFENGLPVETSKLIESFNDVYPPCRKMILFLKKWLTLCKLSGSDRISSYALCWTVIFYLQKELILPSIATLTRMNSRSREIAGWEVGITREYSYNRAGDSDFSMKELLVRYFTFYADFDFRRDVVCPLLGDPIAKRRFADHRNLPKEMRPYIDYMKKSDEQEPLRIDSPMCLQDPVDLQRNVTRAVSKACLNEFRSCCSKSVDVLLDSS